MVDAPENIKHIKYTWEQFDEDVEKIAQAVKATGRHFTHIYGLTRGGLTLAVSLSHRLGLDFATIRMYPFEESITSARLEELEPGVWCSKVIPVEEVLIVDDLSDTGKQLRLYREKGFFIATIHRKPWTKVTPDICIREETLWIDYPWEKEPLEQ